ncbi:MAG: uroporphyrinogen-III synthase [Betaproteobacteria bacterium]
MSVPIVVTRPEDAGRRLTAELAAAGFDALWLPAFDLGPAPDPQVVARALAQLAGYDLAVFVSPAAVRAAAAALFCAWPPSTAIAVVGAATARAVREHIPGADAASLLSASGEDSESGSEGLWAVLQAQSALPRRVLILRAQGGREWLLDRLREAGAKIEPLAVYERRVHAPSVGDIDWLRAQAARGVIATVVTSSEAVAALMDAVRDAPAALAALRAGPALASHPRIAERLRVSGFGDVRLCAPNAAAIQAAVDAT